MDLISDTTRKKSFISYLHNRYRVQYVTPYRNGTSLFYLKQ